ncbi:hypothetical protein [Mycobacterium sp. 050134]|uniref:hypothetical protein n=1 Tax=Mycobacterium sp. 050134 TaxID=3096111 RepID=UPI002ED7914C
MAIMTLSEQVSAVGYIASLERLLTLDAIWTAHLDGASGRQLNADDSAALGQIADEMTQLLSQCPAAATLAHELMQRDGDSIHRMIGSAISTLPAPPAAQDSIRVRLVTQQGLGALISRAAEQMPAAVEAEQRDIAQKRRQIDGGAVPPGDMSKNSLCFAGGVVLGLTTGTAIATGSVAEGLFAVYQAKEIAGECLQ